MDLERVSGRDASLIDVFDRVLDKGVVVDASLVCSFGGIDLITVDAHLIVASIDTDLAQGPAGDGVPCAEKWKESSIVDGE